MDRPHNAFLKGGLGCLGAFLLFGLIAVALGGTMTIDAGGALLLIVVGGVVGLIVRAIYNRGREAGARDEEPDPPSSI